MTVEPAATSSAGPPGDVRLKYLVPDDAVFRAWLESDWTRELGDVRVGEAKTAEVEDVCPPAAPWTPACPKRS